MSCPKETATRRKLLHRGGSIAGLDENAGAQQLTMLQTSKACVLRMEKIAQKVKQILVGHGQRIVGRTSVRRTGRIGNRGNTSFDSLAPDQIRCADRCGQCVAGNRT
jgi:hypothetical protein